jgi:hypothetical protein
MRSLIVGLVLLGGAGTTLTAQETMSLPQAKMQELQSLVGVWDGVGWVEHEGFPRRDFMVAMEVQSKLGGLVLTQELQGKGQLVELELFGDVVFHHSFGIITYDARDGHYRMATIREDGSIRVVELQVSDEGIEYTYDDPELGTVRNTLSVTDARMLYATGSIRHEGDWQQFYQLQLNRKK